MEITIIAREQTIELKSQKENVSEGECEEYKVTEGF
jgi:hypothetical protein